MNVNFCRIRKDLRGQNLAVPVGNFYSVDYYTIFPYRWVHNIIEDHFEINYYGKWLKAQSIDFDFINSGDN